jgi:signal transduction histidine kinase
MKRSWFPILSVVLLLGLLCLLATLQYRWLGQISESEKAQMQKRLETDTQNFAQDFNQIIQSAYFPFQLYADEWQDEFVVQYQIWKKRAVYPDLIKEFYFVPKQGTALRYDFENYRFFEIDYDQNFENLQTNFTPIDSENLILRMPIYTQTEKLIKTRRVETISRIDSRTPITTDEEIAPKRIKASETIGYLLIKLDEYVITEKVLKNLNGNYFSDGNYKISIVNQSDNTPVYQTHAFEDADAKANLLVLAPDNFAFYVNEELRSSLDNSNGERRVIFNRKIENRKLENRTLRIVRDNPENKKKIVVAETDAHKLLQINNIQKGGIWALNVQHSAGSLENFVALARRKSLAVSFGILLLLGVSIVLIFVSAQRAKLFAQKQIDFVSAVSHEFRTPLAVIYSAGENLTDGVVNSETQVAKYGNLIKREGKKLSAMVEQILEFAGANSGRKKYDLRETDVKNLIENALRECQPLLEEKDFSVEREIAENLPKVTVDANALSQAIQNLIINSIKYGNGNKWLKVSAKDGDRHLKITVEDKGVGISKNEISKVFQPFYRSKSVVDAQIHGNGLGLSLVKQTIEAHSGRVSVESELGKGSRFTIHLPLNN